MSSGEGGNHPRKTRRPALGHILQNESGRQPEALILLTLLTMTSVLIVPLVLKGRLHPAIPFALIAGSALVSRIYNEIVKYEDSHRPALDNIILVTCGGLVLSKVLGWLPTAMLLVAYETLLLRNAVLTRRRHTRERRERARERACKYFEEMAPSIAQLRMIDHLTCGRPYGWMFRVECWIDAAAEEARVEAMPIVVLQDGSALIGPRLQNLSENDQAIEREIVRRFECAEPLNDLVPKQEAIGVIVEKIKEVLAAETAAEKTRRTRGQVLEEPPARPGLCFDGHPYRGDVTCTATSQHLRRMAETLELGDVSGLIALFHEHGQLATYLLADKVSHREWTEVPPLSMIMGSALMAQLAPRLRDLAARPDYSRMSFAGLGLVKLAETDDDLVFIKLDEIPLLRNDYTPKGSSRDWNSLLFHPAAAADARLKAYETLRKWARASPEGLERMAYFHEPTEPLEGDEATAPREARGPLDVKEALGLLAVSPDNDSAVEVRFLHPMTLPYGNSNIEAQAWFKREQTGLVLHEECSTSGDLRVDVGNFLSYRQVIIASAIDLNAARYAWAKSVYGITAATAQDLRLLNDEETLWKHFTAIGGDAQKKIPLRWVRGEFSSRLQGERAYPV